MCVRERELDDDFSKYSTWPNKHTLIQTCQLEDAIERRKEDLNFELKCVTLSSFAYFLCSTRSIQYCFFRFLTFIVCIFVIYTRKKRHYLYTFLWVSFFEEIGATVKGFLLLLTKPFDCMVNKRSEKYCHSLCRSTAYVCVFFLILSIALTLKLSSVSWISLSLSPSLSTFPPHITLSSVVIVKSLIILHIRLPSSFFSRHSTEQELRKQKKLLMQAKKSYTLKPTQHSTVYEVESHTHCKLKLFRDCLTFCSFSLSHLVSSFPSRRSLKQKDTKLSVT